MPDTSLEAIIGGELENAGLAETNDMGEMVGVGDDSGDEGDSQASAEGEAATAAPAGEAVVVAEGETAAPAASEPKKDELDATDLELQALGLRAKNDQGLETRIKYSRVRKIWENYKIKHAKELEEKHTQALTPLQQQVQQFQERFQNIDAQEKLLASDPKRFLELLGTIQPAVRQFLSPTVYGAAAPAPGQPPNGTTAPTSADDPMPKPNAKFPDGSEGYDMDGIKALNDWNQRQVINKVTQAMEAKFGKPVEDFTRQQREHAEQTLHANQVKANVDTATKVYGKLFSDDFGTLGAIKPDSAVMATLKANPGMRFMDAVAVALIPKIQADRNKMRDDLLKELDEAGKSKKAAARPGPTANSIPGKGTANTIEETIAEQMRNAGML